MDDKMMNAAVELMRQSLAGVTGHEEICGCGSVEQALTQAFKNVERDIRSENCRVWSNAISAMEIGITLALAATVEGPTGVERVRGQQQRAQMMVMSPVGKEKLADLLGRVAEDIANGKLG